MGAPMKEANRLTDDALLVLFANGDPDAAGALTDRLMPRAFGVALRVLGNRAEAEDITQEAMMRLWRMAPNWQSGQAQVSTWVYRVVMNLCIDLKRRQRGGFLDLDAVPEPEDDAKSAVDQLQENARFDALQAALMQLPPRQRQAVVLRHLEDLSNPEIAAIMEIGVEAVESLTARGKRALAKGLQSRRAELGYADG
ncbi:RNA polymerase sigma-70 factor, ECF subfamily [Epibacterium ulvae]|uniref:RNA polymerase sigma-70 factor, ECF subfamily n=2 Tax=Epibacterium ulvae TaxID=1156985 RepID=A0A1G5R6N9_9RHOB|nr:RNA polymerase sigma-70 factor, ECF subfamily [Epibacterium ulvae]